MTLSLILASGSSYRKTLLSRLSLPFDVVIPDIDETPHQNESPQDLAVRLGEEKCRVVAERYPDAWIIASDQVAYADGRILSKPITHQNAVEQLSYLSGKTLSLFTSLAVWLPHRATIYVELNETELSYADLSVAEIEAYLQHDRPYDCAASSKIEGLGVALLERIATVDPDAIMGLPMLALVRLFRAEGVSFLTAHRG